jgi:hypothetical protein
VITLCNNLFPALIFIPEISVNLARKMVERKAKTHQEEKKGNCGDFPLNL